MRRGSPPQLETRNWKLVNFYVLAVILVAFFLRFYNLETQSLWNDEGNSYVQATRSFADIAANAARDIHPPGYYWLLAVWRAFLGDSEFALRSLSAFASVLTVAFTYALGKHLFNPLAGLFAALFVSLNTFSIYYAQEARMYALLALWAVMGMWALAGLLKAQHRGTERQRNRESNQHGKQSFSPSPYTGRGLGGGVEYALALALINAAGLYTQYAYPFVMLAQGAVVLVWLIGQFVGTRHASSARNTLQTLGLYILANLLTILLYLPWLPTALQQITSWPSTGAPIPAGEAINSILSLFMFGITTNRTPGTDFRNLSLVLLLTLVLLIGGVGKWNKRRGQGILWRVALPVLWFIIPIGLFLALELFRPANLKFLLPSQIAFSLLMGLVLARFWEGFEDSKLFELMFSNSKTNPDSFSFFIATVITLWFVVGTAASVPPLYTNPAYQRADYRGMVAQITADPRPGDAIILDAPNQEEVFRYYYKGDAPVYPLPPGLGGNDAETGAAVQDIINNHDRIFVLFWGEAERDPNRVVERELDVETYPLGNDVWVGDVRLAVYSFAKQPLTFVPSGAMFGENITLEYYGVSNTAPRQGDTLHLLLRWHTSIPLTTPYKIFVQLLNSEGRVVAQRDSEPADGWLPTTTWEINSGYMDRHALLIPANLPPGMYRLIVGLYERDNPAVRLPVGAESYLELGKITVSG